MASTRPAVRRTRPAETWLIGVNLWSPVDGEVVYSSRTVYDRAIWKLVVRHLVIGELIIRELIIQELIIRELVV